MKRFNLSLACLMDSLLFLPRDVVLNFPSPALTMSLTLKGPCTVEPLYKGHLGDRRKWPLERGRNKSQCMDFLSAGTQKSGRCREVAFSGGSTVQSSNPFLRTPTQYRHLIVTDSLLYPWGKKAFTFSLYLIQPA